jgi:hypothetical protein
MASDMLNIFVFLKKKDRNKNDASIIDDCSSLLDFKNK